MQKKMEKKNYEQRQKETFKCGQNGFGHGVACGLSMISNIKCAGHKQLDLVHVPRVESTREREREKGELTLTVLT